MSGNASSDTEHGSCNFCPEGEAVQTVNIHTPNGDSFLADVCYECFLRSSRSLSTGTERSEGE